MSHEPTTVLQGGRVVTADGEYDADVLIDGEEIVAVGTSATSAEVVDATGCFVLPGLIDNHTHMAMPFGGTRSIDDYDTGTRAAAAGGTTCIVDFVIQQEPDGLRSSLDEWQERAAGAAHVDYGFHMAITQRRRGHDRRHAADGRGRACRASRCSSPTRAC